MEFEPQSLSHGPSRLGKLSSKKLTIAFCCQGRRQGGRGWGQCWRDGLWPGHMSLSQLEGGAELHPDSLGCHMSGHGEQGDCKKPRGR